MYTCYDAAGKESSLEGVTVVRSTKTVGDPYSVIEFNDGTTLQGRDMYSLVPIYTFDIKFQKMNYGNGIITTTVPKPLPLTLHVISTLLNNTKSDFDIEGLVCDGLVDINTNAPDQTENLKQYYPTLLEDLANSKEGLFYFRFKDLYPLVRAYGIDKIGTLSKRQLEEAADICSKNIVYLAFRTKLPSFVLHELSSQDFDVLKSQFGLTFGLNEKAALELYNKWLKNDYYKNKHTISLISQATQHCFFWEEGLEYLLKHGIIYKLDADRVVLTEILEWQALLKKNCKTIRERFNAEKGGMPTRDGGRFNLELSPEQQKALSILSDNPIAVMSGIAGSGKTTIIKYLDQKFEEGTFVCLAPTNRAARIVSDKVRPTKTIHKTVLELFGDESEIDEKKVRVLLIDEASMIPERLFSYTIEFFVKKCPNLQRLYLVGDVAQLESVEPGCVLKDFSDIFPSTFLEESKRVTKESKVIHDNAIKIRNQKTDLILDDPAFTIFKKSNIVYNDIKDIITAYPEMNAWNTHFLTPYKDEAKNLSILVKQFITDNLHTSGEYNVGDKLLCNANRPDFGIINGDFFRLAKITIMKETYIARPVTGSAQTTPSKTIEEVRETLSTNVRLANGEFFRFHLTLAPFTNEEMEMHKDDAPVLVDIGNMFGKVRLTDFTLGYCTTNHKFQGCESDYVVFDLRKTSYFVNWKQLYTAVTRSRSKVIIIGNEGDVTLTISRRIFPRRSGLCSVFSKVQDMITLKENSLDDPDFVEQLKNEFTINDDDSNVEKSKTS